MLKPRPVQTCGGTFLVRSVNDVVVALVTMVDGAVRSRTSA
jgi:hypothetical protein